MSRNYYLICNQPGHWRKDSSWRIIKFVHTNTSIYTLPCAQSVQFLSHVRFFVTPCTASCQASLSITNSRSLIKLISIDLMMPCKHLILCHPLLSPPSIFPSIRVFSNESVLRIRRPKYWGFSFSISPSNEYSGLISFRMDYLISLSFYNIVVLIPYSVVY